LGPTTPPTPAGLFAILTFRVRDSARPGTDTTLRVAKVIMPDEDILEIPGVRVLGELVLRVAP
jgi:hypothetical protein